MIEVDDLINDLKTELLGMSLNDRIKYLNSLGFDVSAKDDSIIKITSQTLKPSEDTFIEVQNFCEWVKASQHCAKWRQGQTPKRGGIKRYVAIKNTQIIELRVKPIYNRLAGEMEVNNNYLSVKNLHKKGEVPIEDLMITFKILYEDGRVGIQEVRGNSYQCKYLLNYLEQ